MEKIIIIKVEGHKGTGRGAILNMIQEMLTSKGIDTISYESTPDTGYYMTISAEWVWHQSSKPSKPSKKK